MKSTEHHLNYIFSLNLVNITAVEPVFSSTLTNDSRVYSRIVGSLPNYYYTALQVIIVSTGEYRFVGNSSIDLHGYMYQGTFNPAVPCLNLLAEKSSRLGFELSVFLQCNMQHILVVTSVIPSQTGTFSIMAAGPHHISVHPISKFDCYSIFHDDLCSASKQDGIIRPEAARLIYC